MNTVRHTPGPWQAHTTPSLGVYWVREIHISCHLSSNDGWKEEAEANAALISAAPDLLEALEKLCALQECGDVASWAVEWDAAKATIAKARGEDK